MRRGLALAVMVSMLLAGPVAALMLDNGSQDAVDGVDGVRPGAGPFADPVSSTTEVMDPVLQEHLESMGPGDLIDVLVRFRGEMDPGDMNLLRSMGLETVRRFDFIEAVQIRGKVSRIMDLSLSPRVAWMEYDEEMELLMDESTTTINATKVWNTRIVDKVGKVHPAIDGTGVTAVVLDSGMDAGHPDLDYREKTIMNLKSDSDGGWIEMENSDTSSGHGTHCAGTVAGNGDASAGARRGVAPGANLIGLSTGEAVSIFNALGALEWVYEHTRPHNNPYNIRVVSNSWGTTSEYNPEDAIVIASKKITYENNVVVVFAAGNAGEDNHDGHTVTTNPYSLTPSVLSIAAIERDGSGIADFSSRGSADDNFTWPDFGAPGVHIWATEARKTLITSLTKQNNEDMMDAYYMSISGTSMATPHVSGVVSLLFQAAPSLRVSEVHDDSMENDTGYWNDTETRIHEVEWILKATAGYINKSGENGVPENSSIGLEGNPNDFAQGYGLVQVDKAVGLALTLEELRSNDPQATVDDALMVYENISRHNYTTKNTNQLTTNWFGDWSRLNAGDSAVFSTNTHDVMIPNGTKELNLVLNYNPASSEGWQIGYITVTIDKDGDGQPDWEGDPAYSAHGYREWNIPVDQEGQWRFNVEGQVAQIPDYWRWRNPGDNEFNEANIEYTIGLGLRLDVPEEGNITLEPWDFHARNAILDWTEPTPDFKDNCTGPQGSCTGEGISMETYWYDLSYAKMPEPEKKVEEEAWEFPCFPVAAVVILLAVLGVLYLGRKGKLPFDVPGLTPAKGTGGKGGPGKGTDQKGKKGRKEVQEAELIQEEGAGKADEGGEEPPEDEGARPDDEDGAAEEETGDTGSDTDSVKGEEE